MVENVGRKLVLIAILMGGSLLALLVPWLRDARPFPLGLDIAGGTRLVYRFDFDKAREEQQIGAEQSDADILEETKRVIRGRLDANKMMEASLRSAGGDGIEVTVPATIRTRGAPTSAPLAGAVDGETAAPITLTGDNDSLSGFPGGGGVVAIGSERIRYRQRVRTQLLGIERGCEDTNKAAHTAGDEVVLISDDLIKNSIENLGELQFIPVAIDEHFRAVGSDPLTARQKLDEWLQKPENVSANISDYNALPAAQGGPPPGILWFPKKVPQGLETPPLAQRQIQPHAVQPQNHQFSGADLANVYPTSDNAGLPAVGFQMTGERRADFTEFTTKFLRKQMAIVLNDEYVTDPVIRSPLPGGGIIEGGFTATEVVEMVTVLRSGSLKIKPVLEAEEKVGASIGDDYVRRNVNAALLTFAVIAAFMCFYYRWLGVWATVALVCNLIMLLGAMVLTQSTLTLAGIGGIVLTMGMAVDANILIFERMREEQEKGRKPAQAAKEGFQHALSAIVDGNLTTLITGVILYVVGTGTIKGFAVTLCIGILTTMFAALVITRVLIHYQLQRGVDRWRMVRWMADANFKFMRKAPVAIVISAVVIVVGVGGFILQKDTDKLGIDFLGGASVKARTEHPQQVAHMRTLVAGLPGEIASAEVVDMPSSRDASGAAREFRITFKTDPERSTGVERDFRSEIARGLAEVLQKDRADLSVTTEGEQTRVAGRLYFEKKHSPEDVRGVLAGAGLAEPSVAHRGEDRDVFEIAAGVPAGSTAEGLLATIERAFATAGTDSGGRAYKLAGPIGESSVIGAQVVGELRDSAIMALFWSCLAILLYIRVRFAEYSYGFAALAADLHDVLTTVAAIALLVAVPTIMKIEMNLTMIAAFLTILGYSLNDTIVTFDRIRENRPRVKGTLHEIVDLSINQTLARTIVTGGTVLVSALIILAFNFGTGNVLEGFAFALAFGCLTGTYSSIFIAGPLFVWLEKRAERKAQAAGSGRNAGSKSAPAQPVKGSAG